MEYAAHPDKSDQIFKEKNIKTEEYFLISN